MLNISEKPQQTQHQCGHFNNNPAYYCPQQYSNPNYHSQPSAPVAEAIAYAIPAPDDAPVPSIFAPNPQSSAPFEVYAYPVNKTGSSYGTSGDPNVGVPSIFRPDDAQATAAGSENSYNTYTSPSFDRQVRRKDNKQLPDFAKALDNPPPSSNPSSRNIATTAPAYTASSSRDANSYDTEYTPQERMNHQSRGTNTSVLPAAAGAVVGAAGAMAVMSAMHHHPHHHHGPGRFFGPGIGGLFGGHHHGGHHGGPGGMLGGFGGPGGMHGRFGGGGHGGPGGMLGGFGGGP